MPYLLPLIFLFILASARAPGGEIRLSAAGGLESLTPKAEKFAAGSSLGIYAPGWEMAASLAQARLRRHEADGGGAITEGVLDVAGVEMAFSQAFTLTDNGASLRLEFSAEKGLRAEAVVFTIGLPEREYRGGKALLDKRSVPLPVSAVGGASKQGHVLAEGSVREVTLADAGGSQSFTLRFPEKTTVQVQDGRVWGGSYFQLFMVAHRGDLAPGRKYALAAEIACARAERLPEVRVEVNASRELYPFFGFGGNYCFRIDNGITRFHLRTLRSAVARTEISLREWEPENDNDDPARPRREYFAARDREGVKLHDELLLGQRLAEQGVPVIASVWYLPEWMLENPGADKETNGRRLPEKNWPEFAESLAAYLEYAREKYRYEPVMFSFNEPEAGIKIKFTAAEHVKFVKYLGSFLAGRGIKTRMLLGDAASPGNALSYLPEVLADAEALRWAGGISYHTWGGAGPEVYRKLAQMARQAGKPLYIGEVGTDPGAWRTGAFRGNWDYALKELALYMDLLNHAAPQALLQWQFSDDYALSEETPDGARPTRRYWLLKQFCNWTPRDTRALAASSSAPAVAVAAFGDAGRVRVLHLANFGGACRVRVAGFGQSALRGVVTGRDDAYRLLDDFPREDGVFTVDLPAQSLTTVAAVRGEGF